MGADQSMETQQMQMNMMCGLMGTALIFLCCLAPCIMRYRNQEQKVFTPVTAASLNETESEETL